MCDIAKGRIAELQEGKDEDPFAFSFCNPAILQSAIA